jgi:short-subunit dehydrogenase
MSLMEMTHVFGNRMIERGRGHILLVASLAAYQPTPLLAAYGAAKHFVLAFGQALHVELFSKLGVTVLSPGLMETEFFDVSGYRPKASLRRTILAPARVAEIGLDAMFAGKPSVIAGRLNRLAAFSNRFIPTHLQARLAYRMAKD